MVKNNEFYEAPTITVVDIKAEGVICTSFPDSTDYQDGGDPFNPIIP